MKHIRIAVIAIALVSLMTALAYPQLQMRKISDISAVKLFVSEDNKLFALDESGNAKAAQYMGLSWGKAMDVWNPIMGFSAGPSGNSRIALIRYGIWPGPYFYNIISSTDGGVNCISSPINVINRKLEDLVIRENGRMAVMFDTTNSVSHTLIFFTKDYGADWDTLYVPVPAQGIRFMRHDTDDVCVLKGQKVYKLNYLQKTFVEVFSVPYDIGLLQQDHQHVFYGYNYTENKIAFTTNSGGSWLTKGNPLPFTPTYMKMIADTLYCSSAAKVYASVDTGTTWTPVAIGNDVRDIHRIGGVTYGIAKFSEYGVGRADATPNLITGTNWMSLKKGSKLLYFVESGLKRELHRCDITRDTLIPGSNVTYQIPNPSNLLLPYPFRFDQQNQKLYVLQNGVEKLEMDFSNNVPGGMFHRQAYPAVQSMVSDFNLTVAGRPVRTFTQEYQHEINSITYKVKKYYCDSIGIVRYDSLIRISGYTYDIPVYVLLEMALINTGDSTIYYSAHHKPKLTIQPKQTLSVFDYPQGFKLDHKLSSGTSQSTLVFIDSVVVEHYYKKGTDSIPLPNQYITPHYSSLHYFQMNLDSSLFTQGYTYYYRITATDKSLIPEVTTVPETGFFAVNYDPAASVDDGELPQSFVLEQNFPNPFNPSTTISYTIPKSGRVTLKVYSVLGSEVATLHDGYQSAGTHSVEFNVAALPSGTYFYRLSADGRSETKKFVLLK